MPEFLLGFAAFDVSAPVEGAATFVESFVGGGDTTHDVVALPAAIEVGAIVAGACSGAMTATDERLDIVGVTVLALVAGLGGGLLRDMILPTTSVYLLDNPLSMIVCILVGIAAFFFSSLFWRLDKPIAVFDAISMALFTFMGADKALVAGYSPVACVFLGVITAVGGGVARDVCLARIPQIFKSGNLYAICSLIGAVAYVGLVELHCSKMLAGLVCFVLALLTRWLSVRFNLITVTPVDLTPRIVGPVSRAIARLRGQGGGNTEDYTMVSFQEDGLVTAPRAGSDQTDRLSSPESASVIPSSPSESEERTS